MRIIAGTHRGRRVAAPPGTGTRPMLDRVREAVFSTLAPWLEGAAVLDLCAGSGCLSLEALSRGARVARLVEQDLRVVTTVARNLGELGFPERAQLACGDAFDPELWAPDLSESALVDLETVVPLPQIPAAGWDICFCDPPYPLVRDAATKGEVLDKVKSIVRGYLAPEGILVLHTPTRAVDEADLAEPDLSLGRRTYGTNAIWYIQRRGVEAEGNVESGEC